MNDNDALVVLGRQPELGLAELESLYGADMVRPVGDEAALVKLAPGSMDFDRLGGAVKLGAVLGTVSGTTLPDVQRFLEQCVVPEIAALPEGKIQLGLSVYGLAPKPQQILATGLNLKKLLKKSGRSVRLTPNAERALSSAQVLHNHLTGATGFEIMLVRDGNRAICARTTNVQDIDAYTLRDRGRPKRDARVGMLPPKLAQTIINLAAGNTAPSANQTILDPFCGTGVVLQEALVMGFSAYGTDLEPRMIDYSSSNISWLRSRYPELDGLTSLEAGDATTHQWEDKITAVACETYLGQPFSTFPAREKLERVVATCDLIHKKFLQNIAGQIKPGTRFCLAVPAWQEKPGRYIHLPILDQLGELGYNRVSFEHVNARGLLYSREDQVVARELLVITRK